MTVARHEIKTLAELEAATPEQRRAFYCALLDHWSENYNRQQQDDAEADQRTFQLGLIDEPGPIERISGHHSSTTRIPNL
jgi:hypothetical protein